MYRYNSLGTKFLRMRPTHSYSFSWSTGYTEFKDGISCLVESSWFNKPTEDLAIYHTILGGKSQKIVPIYNGWHSDADVTHSFSFFWRILIFHFYFGDQAIFIEFIVVRSNTNRFKFFIEIVKTRLNWFYIFLTEYYSIGPNLKKSYP